MRCRKPRTQTSAILEQLRTWGVAPVTALVVPGRHWREEQTDWLRDRQRAGLLLAGHGWRHRVEQRVTLQHKLHGLLLSRMVAEHLSLCEAEIACLITRCFEWFIEQGFEAPSVYVPPAWAMGRIRSTELHRLPFQIYESLSGIYRSSDNRSASLPLTGYEADCLLRIPILYSWNRMNELRARATMTPLRISIHPRDFTLGLARQIQDQIESVDEFLSYSQGFDDTWR